MLVDDAKEDVSNSVKKYFDIYCMKLERTLVLSPYQMQMFEDFYIPIYQAVEEVIVDI
jgi:hypothetical protein